ncbi:hypothetical protein WJX77_010488 [Trebouxia sp. C0004]
MQVRTDSVAQSNHIWDPFLPVFLVTRQATYGKQPVLAESDGRHTDSLFWPHQGCGIGLSGLSEMGVIWFKNRPKPIALTPDGRLNLVPFKLDPDTIAINGIEGLVAKDSKSEGTFEQVRSIGLFQATAGSREDPLIVEGEPLGGTAQTKTFDLDPLDTERFASASDYSKGENIAPAKAQLQTIIGREKQRVAGEFRPEHGLGRGSFGTQNLRVTNQNESDGHITGITEVGILEFKRVEGPAELQVAKYCMSQMRDLRSSSSRLYSHSFMPMATCEVVGSELRFGAVCKGFPYVLWDMDSKYEDIDEVVPRKLYKAWDRDNQALVALKLVEVYGFEAASAWSDHHVAVPSLLVRKLPGGFSLVSMPWLSKDQGWTILSSLSGTQMESDGVWPAIQEMLGRAHAPYSQNPKAGHVRYVHGDLRLRNLAAHKAQVIGLIAVRQSAELSCRIGPACAADKESSGGLPLPPRGNMAWLRAICIKHSIRCKLIMCMFVRQMNFKQQLGPEELTGTAANDNMSTCLGLCRSSGGLIVQSSSGLVHFLL